MKKGTLVCLAVLAFFAGWAWVALAHVSGLLMLVVLGTPVVLGVLGALWGE